MLRLQIYTSEETVWRDAARRFQNATIAAISDVARPSVPSATAEAAVFVGAAQAEPAAIQRALAAGRHSLVVAEPCLSRESLESLAAAARGAGVRFAVVNPDRFLPSRQLIQKQIGGPLGSPELVRIHRWEWHAATETTSPLGLPGPLVGELEQALWFVGRPLKKVFALERSATGRGSNGGRFLQVHLSFDAGMALIDYDDRLPGGSGYRSLSVIGSSGSAQTDDQANVQLLYGGGAPRGLVVGEGVRRFATLIDDFAAAVVADRTAPGGVPAWLDAVAVVAAVQRSLTARDAVSWETR